MIGFVGRAMVVGSALWLLFDEEHLQTDYHWAFALGVCVVGAGLWALARALGDEHEWD